MKITVLLALYGGPDQLMPITSGLAAVFAFLLIFWNKRLVLLGKVVNLFRRSENTSAGSAQPKSQPPQDNADKTHSEIS